MSTEKEEYSYEPHRFVMNRGIGKQYCIKCGLISSTNDFTLWAVEKGCKNELHPAFKSTKKRHTNKFNF